MNTGVLVAAFGIGVVSGLRAFTGPLVIVWSAFLGWLYVLATPIAFAASSITL